MLLSLVFSSRIEEGNLGERVRRVDAAMGSGTDDPPRIR
jgi:hypothetical protein